MNKNVCVDSRVEKTPYYKSDTHSGPVMAEMMLRKTEIYSDDVARDSMTDSMSKNPSS